MYDELARGDDRFSLTVRCIADVNGDARITASDLGVFLSAFGTGGAAADVTRDGVVDAGDLSLFMELYLVGC